MFQNATQFVFSVLFILSLGVVWGVLYKVYVKATLEERQEKAKKQAARRSISTPTITHSPTAPPSPSEDLAPPTEQS